VAQSEQEVLVERLGRYPAQRYPVQHATTQFHLGSVLLHAGEVATALPALTVARDVFEHAGMRLEAAKATVMLGVALRTAGRRDEATAAFTTAGTALAALDQPAEQAAAAYNLGLVRQDRADLEGAYAAWSQARELFLRAGYPAQAGAAARDHGGALLTAGRVSDALPLLEQALALAEQVGDEPGAGAAANALGLAHLAAQEPFAAVSALRRALSGFPRSVRPADYAMAKANLALAHEQAGDRARARLAGAQALAVPSAAAPVRAQAQQLLARLPGRAPEDLLAVLDAEDREQWVAVLREEVLRAAELPTGQRCELVSGFLDGVLARPGASYDLAESLLQIVLELPPRTYDLLVSAVVEACAGRPEQGRPEQDIERLRAVIGSALARFALPQWQRLAASLNAAAQASGQPATWR
jgi:tetratricopeptide (TPR) repeat protein